MYFLHKDNDNSLNFLNQFYVLYLPLETSRIYNIKSNYLQFPEFSASENNDKL